MNCSITFIISIIAFLALSIRKVQEKCNSRTRKTRKSCWIIPDYWPTSSENTNNDPQHTTYIRLERYGWAQDRKAKLLRVKRETYLLQPLLPPPYLHCDAVLWLGKKKLMASVNWKLYYIQVKSIVGLDLDGITCTLIPFTSYMWNEKRQWPWNLNLLMAPPNWNTNLYYFFFS